MTMTKPLNILVLGMGKTGTLVAEIAGERGHQVQTMDADENIGGSGLTTSRLAGIDAVIDFTTPEAVVLNITACLLAKKNMVVGTTGWDKSRDKVRELVDSTGTGLVFGSNFSVGMNIFFEIARTAGIAAKHGYSIGIAERHHVHKKDAPSGTALSLQKIVEEVSGFKPEIQSVREGETVGTHVLLCDSEHDTMMLVHDAKSRRGFAAGAVRAAEWVQGKKGLYEFKDIFKEI